MSPFTKTGMLRGDCQHCGQSYKITPAGVVWAHQATWFDGVWHSGACPGAGRLPCTCTRFGLEHGAVVYGQAMYDDPACPSHGLE